jgi:hypothetical protein
MKLEQETRRIMRAHGCPEPERFINPWVCLTAIWFGWWLQHVICAVVR